MPVVGDEAGEYGYDGENRHMVQAFLDGAHAGRDLHDGLAVTEVLMACYMSAEQERVLDWLRPGSTVCAPVARRKGGCSFPVVSLPVHKG